MGCYILSVFVLFLSVLQLIGLDKSMFGSIVFVNVFLDHIVELTMYTWPIAKSGGGKASSNTR